MALRGRILVLALFSACPAQPGDTATEPTGTTAMPPSASEVPTTGPAMTTSSTTSTSTGDDPTTAGPEAKRCQSHCESDRDCRVDGGDLGFRCVDGLCVFPACTGDAQCVAELSGWQTPCAAQGECAAEEACVAVDGQGRCALMPGLFACVDFGLAELMRPPIEGGAEVTVCGQAAAVCVAGECTTPCTGDDTCPSMLGHPSCEAMTGQCVCQTDQDCLDSGLPGYTRCFAGRCGCAEDSDCAGGKNVDTCYAGACGCSADAACNEPVFDGATLACEP